MAIYHKHLSEPWFSMIQIGRKLSEGRLCHGDFAEMKPGDTIFFENDDFGYKRCLKVRVNWIKHYDTFEELLEKETLELSLPGIYTIEEGLKIYRQYYAKEDEEKYKIVCLRIGRVF